MLTAWIVVVCALITSFIATVLVLHKDYEDGLFGRVALAFIALACAARAAQISIRVLTNWWEGLDRFIYVNPAHALLMLGLSMFMARHAYRFLRWHRCGANAWRSAASVTAGKQRQA